LKTKLESTIRIIIAILFLNFPLIGFPAISIILFISTIINKNQIPFIGIHCELPKDKYEAVDEKQFNNSIKIRGYSLAILIFLGWLIMITHKDLSSLTHLITIILGAFHIFISNLILEKYYKLKDVIG
jgi:hypothetical protein